MDRPRPSQYSDIESYRKAWDDYVSFMTCEFESKLAVATDKDEIEILKRRVSYWRNHASRVAKTKAIIDRKKKDNPNFYKDLYARSKEKKNARCRKYRLEHHAEILEKEAKWRNENRELLNQRARDRYHRDIQHSRDIQKKWRDAHRKSNPPVVCPICGKEFVRHNGEQKYCSPACFKENRHRWRMTRYYNRTDEQKQHDRDYANARNKRPEVKEKQKRYANSEAGKAARRLAQKNYAHSEKWIAARKRYQSTETYRIARHRHDIRRRARKANSNLIAVDQGIHWKKLAERQGSMICYLCGKTCDPKGPPRDRPTVDHVIPIALGGTHTWDNVRLACMQCNSGKGMKAKKIVSDQVSNQQGG